MKRIILFLAFIVLSLHAYTQGIPSKVNVINDLEKGRKLNTLLANDAIESLYPKMGTSFQEAVNGEIGFAKMNDQLHQKLGKEIRLIDEASFSELGAITYYRVSEFEKAASITTKWVWKDTTIVGLTINATPEPAPSQHEFYKTKTDLQLPFLDTWYVAWGGQKPHLNKHISAPDQRYALDFLYSKNGKLAKTNTPTANEDFYGFGQEVVAPGAGVVIQVVDTVKDNRLGKINTDSPPGNYVVIDHQNGEYSFLAHFKQGSVKVKAGQTITQGELLGLAGNSGKSEVPHLHYHLQTGTDYREGVGLPIQFTNYLLHGEQVTQAAPERGQYVSPPKPVK
ncbi:M23 family metallopeptidase [Pontibacter akesuensis]|uniref:Peptidase family M23 n=1 Tax=Pontibacter akesuensis TaxID=388950 RepID=A0A1I7KVB3_9BACT|nr:M23 family metallopeptidase [Pontibacter akesuensis]GHA78255.1 hypothetical protein GCM10007389_35330 [Pontibacter akesuensis]SFV01345.1 Peptidase family M23 [Pontibacter akesuensis]